MFEEDLGDDFLTWKPTKMAVGVGLDLHEVQGPKSTRLEKTFPSKMKMDFDFDSGFNKLSSFDIDLSFDSPPSPAKKVKNSDLPKKLKPVDDNFDHPFDLKGFDTVDLHDISPTKNRNSHETEPNGQPRTDKSKIPAHLAKRTVADARVDDRNKSENLATWQKEDTREVSSHGNEGPKPAEPDRRRVDHEDSASPLFQSDLVILGKDSPQDAVGFVDHDNSVHPDSEVDTTTSGSNVPPVSITASGEKAEDSCILRPHSGLESDFGTRPAGERSQRSERSENMFDKSGTNVSDEDHVSRGPHEYIKQQKSVVDMFLTRPGSTTIVNDKREPYLSLDPQRIQTLQFDPLYKSSQNIAANGSQSEDFSQPESRSRPRHSEVPDTPSSKIAENLNQEKVAISNRDGQTLSDSGSALAGAIREENASGLHSLPQVPASKTIVPKPSGDVGAQSETAQRSEVQIETNMTTEFPPVVAALLPEDCMPMQKEGEEEAGPPLFNKWSPAVHVVTPAGKGGDGFPSHAAVSCNYAAPEYVEGKLITAREDPTPAQLTLKSALTLGNTGVKTLNENKGSTYRKEARLGTSKRPASAVLEIKSRVQKDTLQTSRVYLEEGKREGGHDTYSHAKKGRRHLEDHNGWGLPTALAPIAGKGHGFQGSGVNAVRAENQLSPRTLTVSKFFATNGPRSAEKKIGNRVQISSPGLERSSKLMSSPIRQLKTLKHVQLSNTLVENKTSVKKITSAPDVTRGKGLHTKCSSRESRDMKVHVGATTNTAVKRPKPQSSVPTGLQNSLLGKPEVEEPNFQAGKRNRQQEMSLERVEDPAPLGEKVLKKSLGISSEKLSKELSVHGPADSLVENNVSIVKLSNQHTDKLDTMLKNLKSLNDTAKDLLVRALVTNNKLLMLDSPMTQDKKIKASVMEALAI